MRDYNIKLFFKINGLVGRDKWLDAFGRAGAEWMIVAMVGWYVAADLIDRLPSRRLAFWPIAFFGVAWSVGWLMNLFIGMMVREPRPCAIYRHTKLLFQPLMTWKSFPSDHAMAATLLFLLALIFNLPGAGALLVMALWVMWGRVYAGVHYPLDIAGGVGVAMFIAALSYYVMIFIL